MLCTTDSDPSLEQSQVLMLEQHMKDGIICLPVSYAHGRAARQQKQEAEA